MFRASVFFVVPSLLVAASATSTASVLSVNFVGDLTSYTGPASQDPFNPATPLGGAIAANGDLAKFDGQFVVNNFDPTIPGTQTFTFGPGSGSDPNVQFFLHTPILERVEALTTRLASTNSQDVPVNTKILLPRTVNSTTTDEVGVTTTGFFGTGTLTVVDGVPTSFSYNQGADTLQSFDFRFNPLSLEDLSVTSGSTFTQTGTFDLDTPGGADEAIYGYNTPLSAFPSSTVLDTTVGRIRDELAIGAILDTRESSGGVPIADPFADFSGTWFQYEALGTTASVEVVPSPGAAGVSMIAAAACIRRRRHN
ncbi:MAG: hypothetical protein AAGD00_08570 [Planctomycetota bacterium]